MSQPTTELKSVVADETPIGFNSSVVFAGGIATITVRSDRFPDIWSSFDAQVSDLQDGDTDSLAAYLRPYIRARANALQKDVNKARQPTLQRQTEQDEGAQPAPAEPVLPLVVPVLQPPARPKPRDEECPKCGDITKQKVEFVPDASNGPGAIFLTCACSFRWVTKPLDARAA